MNWLLLKNSLFVSSLATLLALGFGFVAALWLVGLEARGRGRLLAVAVMALALPPFLVTNCWLHLLGYTGVWRSWLPLNIFSLGGTVWILSLLLWPITLFLLASAWRRLEPSQLESDPALTGRFLLRGLLWPLGRTALAQASVLTFVLALNNFAVPAILQVKVFPAEIWVRFNTSFDTRGALGLSWPLVVAPLLLLFWFKRREVSWPHVESPVRAKLFRQQLGHGWFGLCGLVTVLVCLLSVGLPFFQLVSVRRTWTELPGALAAGQRAIGNSVWFAALTASILVLLGLAVTARFPAVARHKSSSPARASFVVELLLWLPFLLPGVLLGIGLILLFNRSWTSFFYQSWGIVIAALLIRYLAPGWTIVGHVARTVDRDLTDDARLSGASRWQMLRYVLWPQIAPRITAAWYIVFLLCLWDVESMILVMPPGGETLALRVFNLLHYGHNAQVDALCLALLAVAVAPLVMWKGWSVMRRFWSRSQQYKTGLPKFAFAFSLGTLLVLAGCGPGASSSEVSVESKLFSRVQIIGTRGVGVGQLNKPRSVAIDSRDNLYVVDMTGRVQKFSSNGVFLLSWQMPQTDMGKPKGMCRDRDGNIVVLEPHYQRVNHFAPEGRLLGQWGSSGTNLGQFKLPRAVAVNSHGEIFVSEYGAAERVQRFVLRSADSAGRATSAQFLDSFGHAGTGPGEFNRPEGLCVDAQDRVYVADSCNHRIQIFSSDGKFIRAFGKAGSGKGELSYPYDICVDNAGRQYVCEFGNSRIQIFDGQDQPIEIIGGPGAEPGQFSNPWGVALDSAGNLYVADSQNHRVQKFIRKESAVRSERAG